MENRNDDRFEKMMKKFIKLSKEKNRESIKEHTKGDAKKKKKINAEKRKINEKNKAK